MCVCVCVINLSVSGWWTQAMLLDHVLHCYWPWCRALGRERGTSPAFQHLATWACHGGEVGWWCLRARCCWDLRGPYIHPPLVLLLIPPVLVFCWGKCDCACHLSLYISVCTKERHACVSWGEWRRVWQRGRADLGLSWQWREEPRSEAFTPAVCCL